MEIMAVLVAIVVVGGLVSFVGVSRRLRGEAKMWKDATAGEQQRHIETYERAEKAEALLRVGGRIADGPVARS